MNYIKCLFYGHEPVDFYARYTSESQFPIYGQDNEKSEDKQVYCKRCGMQIGGTWWFDDEERYKSTFIYNFHKLSNLIK
jgi:hypothetical protein